LNTTFNERSGQFSPDGHWMVYASDETGKFEVNVQTFPPTLGGKKWPISQGGGDQPRWHGNGKELYFLAPDGSVMAVDITANSQGITASIPKPLFRVQVVQGEPAGPTTFHWDVTADGRKFLFNTNAEGAPEPVTIVQNWMAGLPKK
jgi:Tol biopolymer transport system component